MVCWWHCVSVECTQTSLSCRSEFQLAPQVCHKHVLRLSLARCCIWQWFSHLVVPWVAALTVIVSGTFLLRVGFVFPGIPCCRSAACCAPLSLCLKRFVLSVNTVLYAASATAVAHYETFLAARLPKWWMEVFDDAPGMLLWAINRMYFLVTTRAQALSGAS